MEIGQNRPIGEGMHIGGFAEEREKIVKEASPGLQKIDSFSTSERNTVNIFGGVARNLLDIFSTPAAADNKPLPASSLQMDGI